MKNTFRTLLLFALVLFGSAKLIVTGDSPRELEMKKGLVADWERAKAFTLEYIEAMPADGMEFKTSEDVRSFQAQFLHIAQGNIGLLANGTGAERIYPEVQNFEKEESFLGKENLIRITSEVYDWSIEAVKNMDMSKSDELVGPNENFQFSRIEWVKKAFEHQTHHRGQASMYLRMKGITPPANRLFR